MGNRYVDRPLNGHRVILLFIVNAHQRTTSAEKDLSNRVDKKSPLNFSLFPRPSNSPLARQAYEKDTWRQTWRLCVCSEIGVSTHHNQPSYCYCSVTTLPIAGSHHWPHGTIPLEGPARCLVADGLHWTTSIRERTTLCSPWNNCFLWVWICFPSLHCFCQNYLWLAECLNYVLVFHITSDQAVHFTASELWPWAHVHGIPGLTMFPITLRQLNWYNSRISFWRLTAPVGGNSLQCWGNVLKDVVHSLNQPPVCGGVSLGSQYSPIRESRDGNGMTSSHLSLMIH